MNSPVSLRGLIPKVSLRLADLVMQMLEKERDNRPESAMAVVQTLEELLKERDVLSGKILEEVAPRAKKYGVELTRVGVKDMVLPGPVKTVFLQEVEAELNRRLLIARRLEQTP